MAATAGYNRPLESIASVGPSSASTRRPDSYTLATESYKMGHDERATAAAASAVKRSSQATAAPTASSPSKKKIQMKKSRLPEVGPTIRDIENGVVHVTGRLLGQGGFARVYQVQGADGRAMAFKAIMKEALLHQRKNRQKVLAEILIHRSLNHPNIVNFIDLFQDEANVYFKLELCTNGSMNDMVRTRGRCLDEEARFYMVQILAGTKHMHNNHVIHRDLKLGNIFMDANMNIKIGDFGLAALLKDPEERKKTMCGTPNYIAPEILYEGNGAGHSFEVDIWSVGVILYTLLSGKPPFQTSSVPAIYEKIRKNEYTIPDHVHPLAAELIKSILTPDPSQRPSLVQIMNHPWFTAGLMPLQVPPTATKATPHLILPRTMEESLRNFETVKRLSGWRDDADDEVEEEEMNDEQRKRSAKEKRRAQEKAEEEREKMDSEFERAIQPGNSLAIFLKLGRKALSKAPDAAGPLRPRAAPITGLSRQLSALSLSRQQGGALAQAVAQGKGGYEEQTPIAFLPGDKENAAHNAAAYQRAMAPPVAPSAPVRSRAENAAASIEERRLLGQKARLVAAMGGASSSSSLASAATSTNGRPDSRQSAQDVLMTDAASQGEVSSLEVMVQNLDGALDAFQTKSRFLPRDRRGRVIRVQCTNQPDELNAIRLRPEAANAYIICWLDEMDKYGLGYALSDGTIGVYLKDDSSITINSEKSHFDHVAKLHSLGQARLMQAAQLPKRDSYVAPTSSSDPQAANLPRDVMRKHKVLSYFECKIESRLQGIDLPARDNITTSGMPYVWRWYRCLQAIVFRLSSSMVQFNFYDHTKLFFSQDGLVLSAIVTDRTTGEPLPMQTWTLQEFVDIAEKTRSTREQSSLAYPASEEDEEQHQDSPDLGDISRRLTLTTQEERKLVRSLMAKVKYARDVMVKISSKDAAGVATSSGSSIPAQNVASTNSTTVSSANTIARARPGSSAASLPRSGSGQSINSAASSARRQ